MITVPVMEVALSHFYGREYWGIRRAAESKRGFCPRWPILMTDQGTQHW